MNETNNLIICDDEFRNIVNSGVFYNPSNKHYPNRNVIIVCDRCRRRHIQFSIGKDNVDVCMLCVYALFEFIPPSFRKENDMYPHDVLMAINPDLRSGLTGFSAKPRINLGEKEPKFSSSEKDDVQPDWENSNDEGGSIFGDDGGADY